MFWSKKKKNRFIYPRIPQFYYMKVGFKGVYITWTCFPEMSTQVYKVEFIKMSLFTKKKLSLGFPTRSDLNGPVQAQK